MSMSDNPAGFRRGHPDDRRPHPQPPHPEERPQAARLDPHAAARQPQAQNGSYGAYQRGGSRDLARHPLEAPPPEARQPAYSGYRQPDYADAYGSGHAPRQRQSWEAPPAPVREQHTGYPAASPVSETRQTDQPYQQDVRAYTHEPVIFAAPEPQREHRPPALGPQQPSHQASHQPGEEHAYLQAEQIYQSQYVPDSTYGGGQADFRAEGLYEPAPPEFLAGASREQFPPAEARERPAYESPAYEAHERPGYYAGPGGFGGAQANPQEAQDRFFPPEAVSVADPAGRQASPYQAQAFDAREPAQALPGNYDDAQSLRWEEDYNAEGGKAAPRANLPQRVPAEDEVDADFFGDEEDFEDDNYAEEKRKAGRKKLIAAVVAGTVLLGGGLGYAYKSFDRESSGSGEPPTVRADGRPVKDVPAEPGGKEFANGNKSIYDRLGGNPDGGETGGAAAAAQAESSDDRQARTASAPQSSGTLEDRIEKALREAKRTDEAAPRPGDEQRAGDEPRRVATYVVRPDGSMENPPGRSGDVVTSGGGEVNLSNSVAMPGTITTEQPPARAEQPARRGSARAAEPRPEQAAAPAPARQPEARPEPRPQRAEAANPAPRAEPRTQVASVNSTGSVPPQAASGGAYFVQIASRQDQMQALAAYADLQQKYPALLGSYSPDIQRVELAEKGVWFRLRVGPVASKDAAADLCGKLKTAGLKSCFATR